MSPLSNANADPHLIDWTAIQTGWTPQPGDRLMVLSPDGAVEVIRVTGLRPLADGTLLLEIAREPESLTDDDPR